MILEKIKIPKIRKGNAGWQSLYNMLWKWLWTCRTIYVMMTITTIYVEYAVKGALDLSQRLRYDENNYSLCRIRCGRGFGPVAKATL